METKNFEIANNQSRIEWIGRKVTGAHDGTINIARGTFNVAGGKLTGGEFTIDTTSIKILDIEDEATNAQFAGHLASDDFFAIEKYPEATLVITSVAPKTAEAYQVEGNLTIKGITHPIAFDAAVNISADTLTATGKITIDRTKYEMKFRSGNFFQNLGDTLIYNDFDLNISVTAKAA
ncbi:YceI family protein [Mucilaginibacter celer]|uniref:YceI family protein n=1 Tax=Mucilaginibacter celer TaxID=2305508 RepID=A0A494W3P7_9SPHI|nr:YceI family protein [Mucilaginibacter celer]AYL97922.1 YceI family protein [Mucilaginibacter celer]